MTANAIKIYYGKYRITLFLKILLSKKKKKCSNNNLLKITTVLRHRYVIRLALCHILNQVICSSSIKQQKANSSTSCSTFITYVHIKHVGAESQATTGKLKWNEEGLGFQRVILEEVTFPQNWETTATKYVWRDGNEGQWDSREEEAAQFTCLTVVIKATLPTAGSPENQMTGCLGCSWF